MFHSVDEAKKKWSKIRNAFNRCLNKVPTNADNNKYICHPKFLNSKWPYYHSMMFMGKFIFKKKFTLHPAKKQKIVYASECSA